MYKCLALVARNHGYATIKHLLENESNYEIITIFTHKLNPKVYDPQQKTRDDFKNFEDLSKKYHIPLLTVDSKEEKSKVEDFGQSHDFDFLLSISWRYIISPSIFKKAKIGAINIHRGELPEYAGIEPIKKALQNNEKEIVVSSHIIEEKIDSGEVLCQKTHPSNYVNSVTLNENVEMLKKEITPYFPELTVKSFRILWERYNEK